MRIKSKLTGCFAALALLTAVSQPATAQSSSLNTYSPYTLYGIGDLAIQGPISMRGMGGTGAAYRSPLRINNLNPASYSAIPRKSALFAVSVEGSNHYLSQDDKKTSFNTFNIREISLQLPLYEGVGFSFSMTPFSRVGYRISNRITNGMIGSEIGSAVYTHEGSGNLTQFKLGVGWAITDYLSVGGDLVYYHGKINRDFYATFTTYTTSQVVTDLQGYNMHTINTVLGMFGVQARLLNTEKDNLYAGATFRMGGVLRGNVTKQVPTSLLTTAGGDAVFIENDSEFKLADTYTFGVIYNRDERLLIGADYSFAQWGVNSGDPVNGVNYRDTHGINFGAEYTPNYKDIRRYFNRVSYRIGGRYNQYYIGYRGQDITEYAVTFGFGFPINASRRQNVDVGFELGMRGKNSGGLIKEQFFKISLGFSMFGGDYWFMKPKFD